MTKRKPRHFNGFPPRQPTGGGRLRSSGEGEWLYGVHAVMAALANPKRSLRRLLVTAQNAPEIAAAATARSVSPEIVDRTDIDALLPEDAVHQGLALLAAPLPDVALEDILAATADSDRALLVILDQATDPRNVGAVLRSAAAFGAAAVIVPERRAAASMGTLAKAASGALESVPLVAVTNLARALDQLKDAGYWCVGLDGTAGTDLRDIERTPRAALVLGSEGEGLRRLTRERCDFLARIPITSAVESLNLSNAAAVALYEFASRR